MRWVLAVLGQERLTKREETALIATLETIILLAVVVEQHTVAMTVLMVVLVVVLTVVLTELVLVVLLLLGKEIMVALAEATALEPAGVLAR